MKRRVFLNAAVAGASAGSLAVAYDRLWPGAPQELSTAVRYPGMAAGHRLRDSVHGTARPGMDLPVRERLDVLVVGGGVAGLSCAWALHKSGLKNFALAQGPVPGGNASNGSGPFGEYPFGAHYLPVPGREARHVRHILSDLGVLLDGIDNESPLYDEQALVHASCERVLHEGRWHEGLMALPSSAHGMAQWSRFLALVDEGKAARKADGRRLYGVARPEGLERDKQALELDRVSFSAWLDTQGITDPGIRWYLDYCARDEYGAASHLISAWAGMNYFCGRNGSALGAGNSPVLTWPGGLGHLTQGLARSVGSAFLRAQTALWIHPSGRGYEVVLADAQGQLVKVFASRLVMCTPLFVSRRLVPWMFEDLRGARGLEMNPWLVANFFLDRFPLENRPGEELAWDNVVQGSTSLGYVVSTHQLIRAAKPQTTVFTTYHALGGEDNRRVRADLAEATPLHLLEQSSRDLDAAYGAAWRSHCKGVEVTVHGHAMASPSVGFLSEPVSARARSVSNESENLFFAHADLSGYSVFEDASYWGVRAAERLTRQRGRWTTD